ncbi:MAG: lysylphosphatidylglycerol synthase transmembrane domain-containing protein [Gemmatimonadota bacterium]
MAAGKKSKGAKAAAPRKWPRYLVAVALVVGLVVAGLHFSELGKFVELARKSDPIWLLLALGLQLATYPVQAFVWQAMGRASGTPVGHWAAIKMSLAKLFVDQSLPTGGVTGTLVVSKALRDKGMSAKAASATVVVYTIANQGVFVLSLAVGLGIAIFQGKAPKTILIGSGVGVAVGALITAGALILSRKRGGALRRMAEKIPPLRAMLKSLAEADPKLTRRPILLTEVAAYQFLVLLIDAATIWVLLLAVGVRGSISGVYASFVFSNVFHAIGIIPGGLGVFEAASVVSLRLAGVSLEAAISATLMYRILSFWLPMIPSWWVAHRLTRKRSAS